MESNYRIEFISKNTQRSIFKEIFGLQETQMFKDFLNNSELKEFETDNIKVIKIINEVK